MAERTKEIPHENVEKGMRLHSLRVNARMKQAHLARAIGYTQAAVISRAESGERPLPESRVLAAAQFLSRSPYLVRDAAYLLAYLTLAHGDLRGCIAPEPRLAVVTMESHEDLVPAAGEPVGTFTDANEKAPTVAGAPSSSRRSSQMSYCGHVPRSPEQVATPGENTPLSVAA